MITRIGLELAVSMLARAIAWVFVGEKKDPDWISRVGRSERACAAAKTSERMVTQEV